MARAIAPLDFAFLPAVKVKEQNAVSHSHDMLRYTTRLDATFETPSRMADLYILSEQGMHLAIEDIDRSVLFRFSLRARQQLMAREHKVTAQVSEHHNCSRQGRTTPASTPPAMLVATGRVVKEVVTLHVPAASLPPLAYFSVLSVFMRESEHIMYDAHVPVLVPTRGTTPTVEELINMLAAAEIIGLRPPPFELRHSLEHHFAAQAPSVRVVQFAWAKLGPYADCREVLNAMVRAYLAAVVTLRISPEDVEEMRAFADANVELGSMFTRLGRARRRQASYRQRKSRSRHHPNVSEH